jgi:hypothetical protein
MDAIGPAGNGAAEPAISDPLDCFASASAKDPLTPALSRQARLGELATQRDRIRERMRMGRGGRPYPLIGRSPLPSRERGQG